MKTKSALKVARKARAQTSGDLAQQVSEISEVSPTAEIAEIAEKPAKRTRAKAKAKAPAKAKATAKPDKKAGESTEQALDPRFNRRSEQGKSLLPVRELTVPEFGDKMTPAKAAFVVACSILQKVERFTTLDVASVIGKNTRKTVEQVRDTQPKAFPDGKIHRGFYALVSGSLQTGMKQDRKTGKMRPQWAQGSLKCLAKTTRVGWGVGEYAIHPDLRKSRGTAYPKPTAELLKQACEMLV